MFDFQLEQSSVRIILRCQQALTVRTCGLDFEIHEVTVISWSNFILNSEYIEHQYFLISLQRDRVNSQQQQQTFSTVQKKTPMSSSTSPNTKETMYFYMLAKELDEGQKKFLNRAVFSNQEALLSSVDLSNQPSLVTKTDVAANDKDFLHNFAELLRATLNLKIDSTIQDNMLQSLFKASKSSVQSSSARCKVYFVQALLAERKFFINLIRSLLSRIGAVDQQTGLGHGGASSIINGKDHGANKPTTIPVFKDDPFLEDEFQKVTQARSQSSLNAPTQSVSKKYPISRLLQPTAGLPNNAEKISKGMSSRDLHAGGSDLLLNETPADLTTYSAKQPQQVNSMTQKLFSSAAATKNSMFNRQETSKRFNSVEENEYHHGAASSVGGGAGHTATTTTIHRVISDRNLGIGAKHQQNNKTKQQSQQYRRNQDSGCFSFAEGFKELQVNNGVYMAEGNRAVGSLEPRPSDLASQSPSFGNISNNKSTHSQHVVRQSAHKKSVLREYNYLFKRKEIVQLKHKWETDDEDVDADVTDSSQSAADDGGNTAALSAGDSTKHRQDPNNLVGAGKLRGIAGKDFEEDITNQKANTKSVNTRRVQKPDQKQIVIGKRANVRTSNKFSKLLSSNMHNNATAQAMRQSNSRSPTRKQQQQVHRAQQQQAQQSGLLFSQNKGKKIPSNAIVTQTSASSNPAQQQQPGAQSAQCPANNLQSQPLGNKKVTSRNNKRSDLYTKSVPSLTTEKPKTKEMASTTSGGDKVDKKANKLLKDASIALAMTMSPKSQTKTGPTAGSKKMANPQYTSSANFERTYQSLSSQKKVIKVVASRSNSSNCSNKDGGSDSQNKQMKKYHQPPKKQKSSSPYRYTDEEYKESMCEPNELVHQLTQEQEFEYNSLKSNSIQQQNKGGKSIASGLQQVSGSNRSQPGAVMSSDKGQALTMDAATSKDSRIGSKQWLSHEHSQRVLALHEQASSEPDEYELNRTDKRNLMMKNQSKPQHMRVKSNLNLSKQSQSKLLPTTIGQTIIEERPTQPKKLEKDAKLLFPSQNSFGAKKQINITGKSNTITPQSAAARRNSEYKGSHELYQVKSVRDQRQNNDAMQSNTSAVVASTTNQVQQPGMSQQMRYTSDGSKQSPMVVKPNSNSYTSSKKLNSHRAALPSNSNISTSTQQQKRLSKSGKRTIESIDSKHSGADKRSPDSGNQMMIQQTKYESKVKQVVTQLAEMEKRSNNNSKGIHQKSNASQQSSHASQQQQHFRKQQQVPHSGSFQQYQQPPIATSTAYGGHRLNIHHDSSQNSALTSQHQLTQGQLVAKDHSVGGGSSQLGAFPVLQDSAKSSTSPVNCDRVTGHGQEQLDLEEENSRYDNDYEDQDVDQAKAAQEAANNGLVRYTQEIMNQELLLAGMDSISLEDGPQTFDKESEDFGDMRQQLIFANNDSVNENSNMQKVQLAQNLNEPAESDQSLPGPLSGSQNEQRTQVHQLFYKKPSESVEQSYQHDDMLREEDDFEEDEDALFGHLNDSQGELSDKVSFNLNNMSHIKTNNVVQAAELASSSNGGGAVGPIKTASHHTKNYSSQHEQQQFSLHKQSNQSLQQEVRQLSQGTTNTIRSTKLKHNMLLKGNNSGIQARPALSKHSKDNSRSNQNKVNSTVRSVSIDLPDQQAKQFGASGSRKNPQRPPPQDSTQQPKFRLGAPQNASMQSDSYKNMAETSKEEMGLRNQTLVSQDVFSDYSEPNQTEPLEGFQQNNIGDSNKIENQDDQLEAAERAHKLDQVRMEILRGQEIRNSRKTVLSGRHMSSSSSDRSCNSVQFKHQLKTIKLGSQEQSPSTKQQRLGKERRMLFYGVDSSSERNDEEQEQEYGANDSNAVQEYTIVNVSKPKSKKATQALASLKAASSPNILRDKRASNKSNHEHYFGVKIGGGGGGSDQDLSSGGAGLSQEDLDSSYNKFLNKQRTRRL